MNPSNGSQEPDFILEIRKLYSRLERRGSPDAHELHIDEFWIVRGSFVAILGPSGCGKTHFLTELGLLHAPVSVCSFQLHEANGDQEVQTHDLRYLWTGQSSCGVSGDIRTDRPRHVHAFRRPREIERLRRRMLGFALQNGELLPALTNYENIEMPMRINGFSSDAIRRQVSRLMDELQIGKTLSNRRINDVSGGQYQRIAIARAIAHEPELVFVDEPTAQLDFNTAETALRLLARLQGQRTTIVMVTHDERLARMFATDIVEMEAVSAGRNLTVGRIKKIETNVPEGRKLHP